MYSLIFFHSEEQKPSLFIFRAEVTLYVISPLNNFKGIKLVFASWKMKISHLSWVENSTTTNSCYFLKLGRDLGFFSSAGTSRWFASWWITLVTTQWVPTGRWLSVIENNNQRSRKSISVELASFHQELRYLEGSCCRWESGE